MPEKTVSRRDFLKIAVAVGGSVTLAGVGLEMSKKAREMGLVTTSFEKQQQLRQLFETSFAEIVGQQGGITETLEFLKRKS